MPYIVAEILANEPQQFAFDGLSILPGGEWDGQLACVLLETRLHRIALGILQPRWWNPKS
jgi:hypothetical protein